MNKSNIIYTIFITGLFSVLLCSLSHAQSVKTGVRGGINFTNFTEGDNLDTRTGYMIGGFVKMNFPESPVSIQPEIYYSEKGAESGTSEIRLEYVEVPILLKLGLAESGPIVPNLFAGPYAGINLNQSSGGGLFAPGDNAENIDFGGVIGAGIDFEAGSAIFTIDARYSQGITPVFDTGDAKNSVFAIVAGISLPE